MIINIQENISNRDNINPDVVDKFTAPKEDIPVSDDEAVDLAFPDDTTDTSTVF